MTAVDASRVFYSRRTKKLSGCDFPELREEQQSTDITMGTDSRGHIAEDAIRLKCKT